MASSLAAIAEGADGKSKADQYTQFMNTAVASGNSEACKQFVDHGVWRAYPLHLNNVITKFDHPLSGLICYYFPLQSCRSQSL